MGQAMEWMNMHLRNVAESADHGLQRIEREPGNPDAHKEAGWRMHQLVKLIEGGATVELTPDVQAAVERFRSHAAQ